MNWEGELEDVVARAGTLDVAEEARRRTPHATRWTTPWATFFEPFALDVPRRGRWLDDPTGEHAAQRVDLDEHGRPVVVWMGEAQTCWRYAEDRWERWGNHGALSVYLLDGGRPAYVVGVDQMDRFVERWTWGGEQLVRVDRARAQPRGWASSLAMVALYDGDLQQILRATGRGDYREDNRLEPDAVMDALRGALQTAGELVPDRVTWDARTDRPEPMPEHPDAGLAAAALERATLAAVAAGTVRDPFCVVVHEARDDPDRTYPPHVLVVSESWRAGMLAAGRTGTAVLHQIWDAVESGHAQAVSLAGFLDDEGLYACRVLRTAFESSGTRAQRAAGRRFGTAIARDLAARLSRAPFLPLVDIGAGETRNYVTAGVALLRDVAPERLTAPAAAPAPDLSGLIDEIARTGLRVVKGRGHSRLGGPALLPAGASWPVTESGRPLTFLAGIDMTELPAFDGRDQFPATGWLLFYADLELGEAENLYLEESGNAEGDRARVLHAETAVAAAGPELEHRAVAFEPLSTLPERTPELGLDPFLGRNYDDAYWEQFDDLAHQIGGHYREYEPGSTVLLHLADDEQLGLELPYGYGITFRVPAGEDLSAAIAQTWQ